MTVETVTYISDFVITNPATGDQRSEGDDHLRNIKKGIKGSFPNFAGAAMSCTEAELNKLDGLTATAAQLEYLSSAFTNPFALIEINGVSESLGTGATKTLDLSGTVEEITLAVYDQQFTVGGDQFAVALGTGGSLNGTYYASLGYNTGLSYTAATSTSAYGLAIIGTATNTGYHYRTFITFKRVSGNNWVYEGKTSTYNLGEIYHASGIIELSGACDIVGVIAGTVAADTFKNGDWVVTYKRSA